MCINCLRYQAHTRTVGGQLRDPVSRAIANVKDAGFRRALICACFELAWMVHTCLVIMTKRRANYEYAVTQDDAGMIGTANSLYEACKKIVGVSGGNVVHARDRRLVAFWNGSEVRPGFGAVAGERLQITEDAGLLVL